MTLFEDFGLSQPILSAIEELGFVNPTPIQEKVIPHLLATTSDMIGLAQTGTGKTAAFGLPLLETINTSSKMPQVLVLSPTRELCVQIANDFEQYGKHIDKLSIVAVYGGADMEKQFRALERGVQVVIGTPGRVKDMINRRKLRLEQLNTLVLDEADEMLQMGFRDELNFILESTPPTRRTLLFTATWEDNVKRIAKEYMHDAVEISVGRQNSGAENVVHEYYMVQAKNKYDALRRIIDFYPQMYGIFFCRTRQDTKDLADKLVRDGYSADALHGDLSQSQRDFVMKRFRYMNIRLLIATDVAARGLDVDDISHIVNYNLPDDEAVYIHRSGRTGRAGKKGICISIINSKEKSWISRIEKKLKKAVTYKEIPGGKQVCEKHLFNFMDRLENTEIDEDQIKDFLPALYKKLDWMDKELLIKKLVSIEFNLFLNNYSNAPDLNITKEDRSSDQRVRAGKKGWCRMFLNIGERDGLKPPVLIGLLNDTLGRRDVAIGKIDIQRNFSFFEVDATFERLLLDAFTKAEFQGRELTVQSANSDRAKTGGGDSREFNGRRDYKDQRERKSYKYNADGKNKYAKAEKTIIKKRNNK